MAASAERGHRARIQAQQAFFGGHDLPDWRKEAFEGVAFTIVFEVKISSTASARLHPHGSQPLMVVGEFAVGMLLGQIMRTTAAVGAKILGTIRFWTMLR